MTCLYVFIVYYDACDLYIMYIRLRTYLSTGSLPSNKLSFKTRMLSFFKLHLSGKVSMHVCVCVCVCVHACVCAPLRLLISNSIIWIPYDWLNRFSTLYTAAVIGIVRCSVRTEACYRNQLQPNKSKLTLYNLLLKL